VAAKLTEIRIDHDGDPLPAGVYALAREAGAIGGYSIHSNRLEIGGMVLLVAAVIIALAVG
jgi:hypothetical protein